MNTTNLAIAIPVYIANPADPRAGYFKRHLHNLALASRHWPVYFAIDGGGDGGLIEQMIAEAGIRNVECIRQPARLGLGLNIHSLRTTVFDRGHDLMMLLESDVVITYDLITLLSHVLDWASSQGWSPAIASTSVASHSDDPHAVTAELLGWSNYLMPVAAYEMMRPALDDYAGFLDGVAYEDRPHTAIQEWLRVRFASPAAPSTHQDAVCRTIAHRLGIHRFSPARNRAIHVGEVGTNSTPAWHTAVGHTAQTLHPHENDTSQRTFNIIPTPATAPVVTSSGGQVP